MSKFFKAFKLSVSEGFCVINILFYVLALGLGYMDYRELCLLPMDIEAIGMLIFASLLMMYLFIKYALYLPITEKLEDLHKKRLSKKSIEEKKLEIYTLQLVKFPSSLIFYFLFLGLCVLGFEQLI